MTTTNTNGKGSRPRTFGKKFRENYDQIDWEENIPIDKLYLRRLKKTRTKYTIYYNQGKHDQISSQEKIHGN